tara:strand:+ start:371 stop:1354 length:984 start_codon:yes stop_codon:yes gene_type:complete
MSGFGYNVSGFGSFPSRDSVLSGHMLIVAGGGSGGHKNGGGGGAGGYKAAGGDGYKLPFLTGVSYTVTIGAGGAGATNSCVSGADTTVAGDFGAGVTNDWRSRGGGGGAGQDNDINANKGGSGGGGAIKTNGQSQNYAQAENGSVGGVYYQSTGNNGVAGVASNFGTNDGYLLMGGGGGAGGHATQGVNTQSDPLGRTCSAGGVGTQWLNGTKYAGGGEGSIEQRYSTIGVANSGGARDAGGGAGGVAKNYGSQQINYNPTSGSANTGGGGGGCHFLVASSTRTNGGSGVVIFRYLGATAASGGTITSVGGYTFHTFTSSGTFAPNY